jgi:hypothetical protein
MTTFADRTTTHRRLSSFCFALAAALAVAVATCKPSEVFGIRPGTVFVSVRDSFFTPEHDPCWTAVAGPLDE